MTRCEIEMIYPGRSSWLDVKGRSSWITKKTAVKHARDVAAVKSRDGMMRDLIAVRVWRIVDNCAPSVDDIIETIEVQQ